MGSLKLSADRAKIVLEYGTVRNFSEQNGLNEQAVFGLLNVRKGVKYFSPNSEAKKAFDKLNELGYITIKTE